MKFVDLLEDYCKVGQIRIMKVRDSDAFYAVISLEDDISKGALLYCMERALVKKMKDKRITVADLRKEIWEWVPIQRMEETFSKSPAKRFREMQEAKNVTKNNTCPSCGRKNDVNSNFCTVCGKSLK